MNVNELSFMNPLPEINRDRKKNQKTDPTETELEDKRLKIFGEKMNINYLFIDINNYHFKTWKECFLDKNVKLRSLVTNHHWLDFFNSVKNRKYFEDLETKLSSYIENERLIFPYAEFVFNAFNLIPPNKIKVVILGQDPYINIEMINKKQIPQAMGLSFSVPYGISKPPSLQNIFKNLFNYGHIKKIPDSGCLAGWILQGCFLINSAFTTFYKESNAHKNEWSSFSKELIKYLNDKCTNIVFVAWGLNAYSLCKDINTHKHNLIISSHPSRLSFNRTFTWTEGRNKKEFPSFSATNHFGKINEYLESVDKLPIIWDLI
uniref:Uracil-DNA glycosylase-like domain-containing protein n=1 Tax=viral metagenome TaxID=1070528 RepID=A0A6C0LTB8_9ZZZZ